MFRCYSFFIYFFLKGTNCIRFELGKTGPFVTALEGEFEEETIIEKVYSLIGRNIVRFNGIFEEPNPGLII